MTSLDRMIWVVGLAALVLVVVYWSTIKAAWKNRATISAAASAVSDVQGVLQ